MVNLSKPSITTWSCRGIEFKFDLPVRATYSPNTWLATKRESTFASRLRTPIRAAMRSPAIRASYSASLFVGRDSKAQCPDPDSPIALIVALRFDECFSLQVYGVSCGKLLQLRRPTEVSLLHTPSDVLRQGDRDLSADLDGGTCSIKLTKGTSSAFAAVVDVDNSAVDGNFSIRVPGMGPSALLECYLYANHNRRSLLGSNVRNIMSPPADSSSNNVHAVDVRRPRSIFSMWGGTCRLPPPAPTDLVAVVATAIWSLDCPPDCSLSRFCVPRLSEESSEDELTLLRRLRHCPRSPELGGLSFGERLCPSLLWTKSRCQQPITER
ncbi:hypothetical protein Tco_0772539 [Tanacetum coccineum]|uniref:Uncharacterized protein n=1 Tax=Tanacetum coccineum TaxID=301880 RepID=A0ABQ4ZM79_9ASTR